MLQIRQFFQSIRTNAVELSISGVVIAAGTLSVIASDAALGHNGFIVYVCGFVAGWSAIVLTVWALTKLLEYSVDLGVMAFLMSHIKR
jgi:NhaP-type Na+/H+ and K+/H+ antiporter